MQTQNVSDPKRGQSGDQTLTPPERSLQLLEVALRVLNSASPRWREKARLGSRAPDQPADEALHAFTSAIHCSDTLCESQPRVYPYTHLFWQHCPSQRSRCHLQCSFVKTRLRRDQAFSAIARSHFWYRLCAASCLTVRSLISCVTTGCVGHGATSPGRHDAVISEVSHWRSEQLRRTAAGTHEPSPAASMRRR